MSKTFCQKKNMHCTLKDKKHVVQKSIFKYGKVLILLIGERNNINTTGFPQK